MRNSRLEAARRQAVGLWVYLAVHSVQLVVEGHGEVGGGAGGHVGDKGRLALVHRVVHVDATLADLHVLEAGLDAMQAERERGRERERDGRRGVEHQAIPAYELSERRSPTVCCGGSRGGATWSQKGG